MSVDLESTVLPLYECPLVLHQGYDPRTPDSESGVLPITPTENSWPTRTRTWNPRLNRSVLLPIEL